MRDSGKVGGWTPDEWMQADGRARKRDDGCECRSTKQHETRCWNRTVFVPEGWQPIDIIKAYPFALPSPPFHAGHMVNKRDVECIASAMVDPNLRWRTMCDLSVAPFEVPAGTPDEVSSSHFNPHDYAGCLVLTAGHHRFLAYLLCGLPPSSLPPSELPPLRIREMPIALPYIFPWSIVVWSG